MVDPREIKARDRTFLRVRVLTAATVISAVAATGALAKSVAVDFEKSASKNKIVSAPPKISPQAAPSQIPAPTPQIIVKTVHVAAAAPAYSSFISAPRRGVSSSTGGSAPPPPPACVSTPSMPC